ncbi:DUF2059 domain-containing protein [Neptunitalea lumnitzerae]|uniref:DUF2059 domain-containing protein n=1 Tax=Neptunitalea lumnitzerae TaxID=2965509 RepID=A0ABQ5MFM7_9FLAO|nr:DUF2059 domain-containing protein [Neptunitalea sp. Y10]GLB47712.1 hypothetical protein Y10_00800 [Neptunitalea sp. Y10]
MKKVFLLLFIIVTLQGVCAQNEESAVAYEAKVHELLKVGGTEAVFKASIENIFAMYEQQNSGNDSVLKLLEAVKDDLRNQPLEDLVAMLTPVYKKHFTMEDLDQLIAFYNSDIGKKLVEKTPMIMQESSQIGQLWGRKLATEIADKIKAATEEK